MSPGMRRSAGRAAFATTALEEAGAFELEGFPAGTECSGTWKLKAGTYTVFCVIETDGKLHSARGMVSTLTVT